MKVLLLVAVCCCVAAVFAEDAHKASSPSYGSAFDEVVVESSLNVRKKPTPVRETREIVLFAPQGRLYRQKRQFGGGFGQQPYGSSSALANAASQGQYYGPGGFGGSAGSAQGQAFNSQGPLGGFGASAAGTQTQGFHAGPDGIRGSAGQSGSQVYNLPGGRSINVAYTGGFSAGPEGASRTGGNSVTFS